MNKTDWIVIEKDSLLDHMSGGIFNGRKQQCCIEECNNIANVNGIFGLLCMYHDKRITDFRNGKDAEAGKLKRRGSA